METKRRTLSILLGPAIVVFALVAAKPMSAAGDAHDQDREAIGRTVANFEDAWNRHDAHAFAMTFTEDADFTNVVGAQAQGRASIETFHAPAFAGIFSESHQTGKIRSIRFLRSDLASVDVDWEMTGAKAADGSVRPRRSGLLSWTMAKQPDGSWLIQVMHNTELPGPPPAPPAK